MEIERKWLVDKDKVIPMLKTGVRIEQHYLNTINDRWLVRVRKIGTDNILTLKSQGLMSREELEYDITEDEYLRTIKHAVKSINKTRFYLAIDEVKEQYYEIDIYDDYDFIICEVEFESEIEALSFIPPDWCTEEVTNDSNYTNVILAK
jgi:CYTH domain-containing protein